MENTPPLHLMTVANPIFRKFVLVKTQDEGQRSQKKLIITHPPGRNLYVRLR
jgi:hypothetical protein